MHFLPLFRSFSVTAAALPPGLSSHYFRIGYARLPGDGWPEPKNSFSAPENSFSVSEIRATSARGRESGGLAISIKADARPAATWGRLARRPDGNEKAAPFPRAVPAKAANARTNPRKQSGFGPPPRERQFCTIDDDSALNVRERKRPALPPGATGALLPELISIESTTNNKTLRFNCRRDGFA